MGTGILLLLIAVAFAGKKSLPDVDFDEDPDVDDEDEDEGEGRYTEPDYKPGPIIDAKKLEPLPDDSKWLGDVEALVRDAPVPGQGGYFWAIKPQGDPGYLNGSQLARRLLTGASDTGSNRLRLLKCMTRVDWNANLYASTNHPTGWGTLYDVEGQNLSAAWLPRHAPAVQYLANHQYPPRTIGESAAHIPGLPQGYFGLLWIPKWTASASALQCNAEGPPAWLEQGLG